MEEQENLLVLGLKWMAADRSMVDIGAAVEVVVEVVIEVAVAVAIEVEVEAVVDRPADKRCC